MIPIKELNELPFSTNMTVALFCIMSVVPANLIMYYFESGTYVSLDFFKLMILTIGSGTTFTSISVGSSFALANQAINSGVKEQDSRIALIVAIVVSFGLIVISCLLSCLLLRFDLISTLRGFVWSVSITHLIASLFLLWQVLTDDGARKSN